VNHTPTFYTHRHTQKETEMFLNQDQVIDHQKKFWNAMVDLKVDGWKAFSDAYDAYTMGFFKNQLKETTSQVEQLAEMMKGDK